MTIQHASLGPVQAKRKVALVIALVFLLAVIALTQATVFGPVGHQDIEIAGRVLLAVCIIGRVWCSLYIGGRKNKDLIVVGPYSVVRNPLYVFSFLGAAGAGAQSGSAIIAAVTLVAAVVVFALVVRREEATLLRLMGEPYADYMRRTPRFVPNLALWSSGGELRPNAKRVLLTFADSLVFLAAIPICEGLEQLQAAGYLPALMNLP